MPRHLSQPPTAALALPPMPTSTAPVPLPPTLDPSAELDPRTTAPIEFVRRLAEVESRATSLHDPVPVEPPAVNVGDRVRICVEAVVTQVNHGLNHTSYRYAPTDEWPHGQYAVELPNRTPEDSTVSVEVL